MPRPFLHCLPVCLFVRVSCISPSVSAGVVDRVSVCMCLCLCACVCVSMSACLSVCLGRVFLFRPFVSPPPLLPNSLPFVLPFLLHLLSSSLPSFHPSPFLSVASVLSPRQSCFLLALSVSSPNTIALSFRFFGLCLWRTTLATSSLCQYTLIPISSGQICCASSTLLSVPTFSLSLVGLSL